MQATPSSNDDPAADLAAARQELEADLAAVRGESKTPTPETWSDWAINKTAEWLPAIGGTVGGIMGGAGGTVFGMGVGGVPGALGGATLGAGAGEAYKQLMNRARGASAPATSGEAAATIGTQSVVQGAIPQAVGMAAAPVLKAGATRLMQSAVKPTLAAAKRATGGTPQLVQTLLDEGINVSARGADKLMRLIEATNKEIKDALALSTARISPLKVASRLTDTAQRVTKQVNPLADLEAVSQVGQEFLEHPAITSTTIPVQQAQAMKTGTYRALKGKYGELKSAAVEAQKALARGLKEEIASEVPAVQALNAAEGKLLQALDVVGRRVALKGNLDPIGFAWVTHNPLTFLAALTDRNPAVKSFLARGMWNAAGTVTKTSPILIRAALTALAQSPDDQPRPATPESR